MNTIETREHPPKNYGPISDNVCGQMKFLEALSPTGERKLTSSLVRYRRWSSVQSDQRRLLKMWLSNDDKTLKGKLSLQQIQYLESRIAKPETPLGVEVCTRC